MADSQLIGRLSLDELLALNDELISLVRAGVPLERGLAGLGGDMPGRLGSMTRALGLRLERGEPLSNALSANADGFPRVYGAVVEAGLRSGRLAAALESLASSTRRLAELRSMAGTALMYPLIVLLLAYGLFVFYAVKLAPHIAPAFAFFRLSPNRLVDWVSANGSLATYWGWLVPLAVLLACGCWWRLSGRASLLQAPVLPRLFGWIPWVGRMLADLRAATFAEIAALLVEHDVPLDQAALLAAASTGNTTLERTAERIAVSIRQGTPLLEGESRLAGLPPLLAWLMGAGNRRGLLLPALRHAADNYRRRAISRADVVRIFLPVLLTLLLGGTATFAYALTVLLPWFSLLRGIS